MGTMTLERHSSCSQVFEFEVVTQLYGSCDHDSTSDESETYYSDMEKTEDTQHIPILTGGSQRSGKRSRLGGMYEVLPLVAGQRSKEWLELLKIFGISTEDRGKILNRLVCTLLL